MCSNGEEQEFDNVEVGTPNDDCASVARSTMGSVVSCNDECPVDDNVGKGDDAPPDWENLNDKKCEWTISNMLRNLTNIKMKRKFKPLILKDMLGADVDCFVGSLIKITENRNTLKNES